MSSKQSSPESTQAQKSYWQAESISNVVWQTFEEAKLASNRKGMRKAFFLLTHYYGRTINILRQALKSHKEPLALASMQNLIVLDRLLGGMHRSAPDVVPLALPLTEQLADQFLRELVLRAVADGVAIEQGELLNRLTSYSLLGQLTQDQVEESLQVLVDANVIKRSNGKIKRIATKGAKQQILSIDNAMLKTLVGEGYAGDLTSLGFDSLSAINARKTVFIDAFSNLTQLSPNVAEHFVQLANAFDDERRATTAQIKHQDLLRSSVPRLYQRQAFERLRLEHYQGLIVESLTGSGKTLMGLMCLQDWIESSGDEHATLILVPSSNYLQQWLRACCFSKIGLQLQLESVFAGTLESLSRDNNVRADKPSIIIATYKAISGKPLGESDNAEELSNFLREHHVNRVILDEAHGLVAQSKTRGSKLLEQLSTLLKQGRLSALIGFSGTASSYRPRFEQLGLAIAHTVPATNLVASGFVAPFAEFGVAFNYSERELAIRDHLDQYKAIARELLLLVGQQAIQRYREIPMERREYIASCFLRMESSTPAAKLALQSKLRRWETIDELTLRETDVVTIVQINGSISTKALTDSGNYSNYDQLLTQARSLILDLSAHLTTSDTHKLLTGSKFVESLEQTLSFDTLGTQLSSRRKFTRNELNQLHTSVLLGFSHIFNGLYRQMGEGRVSSMRQIIETEIKHRDVGGIIIFDNHTSLDWKKPMVNPGFAGTAGIFSELMGRTGITPVAALSSELYLPHDASDPLTSHIADYISRNIMQVEMGGALQELLINGLSFSPALKDAYTSLLQKKLNAYISQERTHERTSIDRFNAEVMRPVRRQFGHRQAGVSVLDAARIRQRLSPDNKNLRPLLQTLSDYSGLARLFSKPTISQLQRSDGSVHSFSVISMPDGRKRQLAYDLVSRLIDEDELAVNVLIVTDWARTGWNVVSPNVLIDATATRDVTAWQQLRGRAMRALPGWSSDCHQLLALLMHHYRSDLSTLTGQETEAESTILANNSLLPELLSNTEKTIIQQSGITGFSRQQLLQISVRLMLKHNKATHIYELLKADGTSGQIRFNKQLKRWVRKEHIAAKHDDEFCVDISSGQIVAGEVHAPIIYDKNPITDSPESFIKALAEQAVLQDQVIVQSWLLATE